MNRRTGRKILLTIHSLPAGGAEKFFTTLATALHPTHDVHCHIPCLAFADPTMRKRLSGPSVSGIPLFTPFGYRVFYKVRQLLRSRIPALDLESTIIARSICRLHEHHSFDLINSHLYLATLHACQALAHSPVKIIESDHGHYAFLPERDEDEADAIFQRLDALVYPASSNERFSSRFPWSNHRTTRTIPYGSESSPKHTSATPRLSSDHLHIGMVARGVEEKGWLEAIAACRAARTRLQSSLHLHLVGEGPCIAGIRSHLSQAENSWITLYGHVDPPDALLRQFDLALLPTFLPGESLPNSVIEYLRHSLPVIATPAGGIPEMIQTPAGPAGILIGQTSKGRADIAELTAAIVELASSPKKRQSLAALASTAGERFDIPICVAAYEALFEELLTPKSSI